jgi:hypothetical protein
MSLYLVLFQSKKPYGNSLKVYFLLPYDALNGYFVEQYVYLDRYTQSLQIRKERRQVT